MGEKLSFLMWPLSGDLDPYLLLQGPHPFQDGRMEFARDDNDGIGWTAWINSFTINHDATYVIIANRFEFSHGTSTGGYVIQIQDQTPGQRYDPLALDQGSMRKNQIVMTIFANGPRQYEFRRYGTEIVTVTSQHMPGYGWVDPFLTVERPGIGYFFQDNGRGGNHAAQVHDRLPQDSFYTVLADDHHGYDGDGGGYYFVTFTRGDWSTLIP